MEIGISMFGDNHFDASGKLQPVGQRLRELIEAVKLMDQIGLDFFGIGEHHRPDYSVSTPEIILAAAASVTQRIKLGSAVTVLSSADPVRVYQQFATIDHLSNGRAEITVGRGSFTESFPVYGFSLNDYEALFAEKLGLLRQINERDPITWSGRFRPSLHHQAIFPRAAQEKIPIWVAVGGTPESVVRAAEAGLPVIFAIIGGNPAQFKPLFDYHKQLHAHFKHPPGLFKVGVHMHCFFGENSRAVADAYYPHYAAQMNRVGRDRGWPPYQRSSYDLGREKGGALIIGDVNEAVDKILTLQQMFGLTRFAAHMDVGGPPHIELMKSIELFGDKIAPKLRETLGKP